MPCDAGHQADPLSTGRPNALRKSSLENSLEYNSIKRSRSIDQDHPTKPITSLCLSCALSIALRCKRRPPRCRHRR
jgi:hypothetical protein